MNKQLAFLCAGSFWHSQLKFSKIKGVIKTEVGYEGGNLPYPSYSEVNTGNTGHVETVKITYDTNIISFAEILEEFWKIHDPTSLNQKGFNGSQYRSTIFYCDEDQKIVAEKSRLEVQNNYEEKIVTEIKKATQFYLAEEMHQYYLLKQEGN